jgi:hypothetical protein
MNRAREEREYVNILKERGKHRNSSTPRTSKSPYKSSSKID